jgi:hypothetical protein
MAESTMNYSRIHVDFIVSNKYYQSQDFIMGDYHAYTKFYSEMSRIVQELNTTGKVKLETGTTVDGTSMGGIMALQVHVETLKMMKDTMSGISKLGIKAENKMFSMMTS